MASPFLVDTARHMSRSTPLSSSLPHHQSPTTPTHSELGRWNGSRVINTHIHRTIPYIHTYIHTCIPPLLPATQEKPLLHENGDVIFMKPVRDRFGRTKGFCPNTPKEKEKNAAQCSH